MTPQPDQTSADEKKIRALLSRPLCVPSVKPGVPMLATHDDNDGDQLQCLTVVIDPHGDMYVQTHHDTMLRYRTPVIGGGRYEAIHNALRILAVAILMDTVEQGRRA